MKRQVYIRVEGNQRVGLGHFMRCLALAEMLDSHFEITFVGKKVPEDLLQEKNLQLLTIEEEQDFFEVLNKESIVIVDGYDFDEIYYELLKGKGVTVVSIQDIYHFSENIDLVINHLPDSEELYTGVEILSGPKYAIIRSAFLESSAEKGGNSDEVFISLGGTENHNLVNSIIKMLNAYDPNLRINILTTDENGKKIKGENIVLFSGINERKIVELIDSSSVCLITSGMISYEVLARNKKAVVGALNDGQDAVGKYFEELELVEYLGYWKDVGKEKLSESLLMKNVNQDKIRTIFDGKSGERIRYKFLSL